MGYMGYLSVTEPVPWAYSTLVPMPWGYSTLVPGGWCGSSTGWEWTIPWAEPTGAPCLAKSNGFWSGLETMVVEVSGLTRKLSQLEEL